MKGDGYKKHTSFGTSSEVPPDGIEAPDTRSVEKAESKRAVTIETLTEALKNRVGSDNSKLIDIINSAEQAAEKQLNSPAASMSSSMDG